MNIFGKKIIPALMLMSVVLSFLPIDTPQAQAAKVNYAGITVDAVCLGQPSELTTCPPEDQAKINSLDSAAGVAAANEAAAKQIAAGGKGNYTQDGLTCSLYDIGSCLANVVYVFTVGLGSGMAYVGGFVFDMTVSLSLNSAAYALNFLSAGWTTARDLANMGFILILVYIAFMIMFQAETPGTMRMLAWVIFIALIINFSFFLTRVVIDAGNILAVQFYNAIDAPTMAGTFSTTNANTGTLANVATGIATKLEPNGVFENTKDLTAGIMQALNIQELFNDANFKNFAKQSGFGTKLIILSFLYIAIGACYFILAAMFLAVGIKFLVRIVVLWFLIIAAPFAFIAKAMPQSGSTSSWSGWYDQWQGELVKHAFYPAVFLFMFLFINIVLSGLRGSTGILGGLATDLNALNANPNIDGFVYIASAIANVGIRLGFIIAMLYIALKVSEKIGVQGAAMAQKATSFAFGQTGQLISAPVGWAGRQTFGRLGNRAIESAKLYDARAKNATGLYKRDLQLASKTYGAIGKSLASTTYDPRNAPGSSVLKKGVEKITGSTVNAGTPATGGIAAQIKERNEQKKAAENEEKRKAREEENTNAIRELAEKSAQHDALEAKEKAGTITAPERTHRDALKHQIGKIENKVNGLNKTELESFKSADIQKVLKHLNKDTIKKINDSEKYTEQEKEKIRTEHDLKMREKAGEKAIEKSQEIIEELRGVRQALTTNGRVAPASLQKLERATLVGQNINHQVIKEAVDELKIEKMAAESVKLAATTQEAKERAEYAVKKLDEAKSHLEEIKRQINDVPETIGDTPNSKEFKIAA